MMQLPAYLEVFASGGLDSPSGMALGPDGNLYVSSTGTDEVLRFDRNTGAFLDKFIRGIRRPSALALGPDGNLYVGSFATEAIYKCHGRTGEVLATFGHSTGTLAFDINGSLFASNTPSNTVDSYSIQTGSLIRTFGSNTALNVPAGIVFANPILFVASNGTNSILRFSAAGQAMPPIPSGPELSHPLALAFSPQGILYVSTSGNEVLRYEFGGRFLGQLIAPGTGGLQYPAAMVLVPDSAPGTASPDTMRIVPGDGQESIVRNLFPEALTVEVLSGNRPLGGQTVRFEVTSGLVGLTSSQ